MELKLVRGIAADLTPPDKKGCVVCRVGERTVQLHRDLATAAKAGDDVLVGGELHNEVAHVLALKNFTRPKLHMVDFTFYILGGGVGGYLALLGLILLDQSAATVASGGQAVNVTLITVGSAIVFYVLRRVIRILKLTRWVDSVAE